MVLGSAAAVSRRRSAGGSALPDAGTPAGQPDSGQVGSHGSLSLRARRFPRIVAYGRPVQPDRGGEGAGRSSSEGRGGSPRPSRPARASRSPTPNTTPGGHRSGEQDGAICSSADVYSPLGASHVSLSGERSAFSCSVANTWNRTQPTEKVAHCAAGSRPASYRHAACTDAGASEVLKPASHTRVPGAACARRGTVTATAGC